MKNLSIYLNEALKKVGEYRDKHFERDDSDIIQILDRSFKEGGLTDSAFKSWMESDIKECFSLDDSKLNKDYDKAIDYLSQIEIDKKITSIKTLASRLYKTQSRQDNYIQKAKDDIREEVLRINKKHLIERIDMQLNPISGFSYRGVARDNKVEQSGDYIWSKKTLDELLDWFESFGYSDNNGSRIDLRRYVVGWTITYSAYKGTECPKNGTAYLELKLNKEGQALVSKFNKGQSRAIGSYYNEKGSGGYTGD